jgi:hypothetical protein
MIRLVHPPPTKNGRVINIAKNIAQKTDFSLPIIFISYSLNFNL